MATPDVGDSAVLELVGLGAAAAAGSPAVAAFVGGTMADARTTTEELDLVCAGRSTRLRMPVLDLRGTPLGVDARRVVELGITPKITTGVLHASAGVGQVGAGVGAGTGAVAAKVIDHGVSDEWVGWFRETVQTGTTTLVLL
ncbi:MAG: hypothetical protein ACRD07_15150, partial [Acidimicrobiales bacterium]